MMADLHGANGEHEMFREALGAAAIDALSDEEMKSVLEHVAHCESCSAELSALRRYASQLSYAAPIEPIDQARSDRVRKQLIARAKADRQPLEISSAKLTTSKEDIVQPQIPKRRVVNWVTAAALAASVVALAALVSERRGLLESLDRERAGRVSEVAALRGELSERDAALSTITGPSVKVIALAAPTARPVGAVMFWDRASDQWTFIAHDLPRLELGRTYQLWLVLGTSPRSIAVFAPDALGYARVSIRMPLDPNARPQVAVTDEPGGGSTLPTTNPIMVGQVSG
ncbi:MAG: anti-sigma factor [Anaerolineae bacterium]|nr:anti-sigma factor [Gemmatimonadaceae bacterium]